MLYKLSTIFGIAGYETNKVGRKSIHDIFN